MGNMGLSLGRLNARRCLKAKDLNMAEWQNMAIQPIYPMRVCASTVGRQIAAADRPLWPLAGPRTGDDGAAAGRPLRLLPWLLLASPCGTIDQSFDRVG